MTFEEWSNAFTLDLWTSMADGTGGSFEPLPSGEMIFGEYEVAFRPADDDARKVRIVAVHLTRPLSPGPEQDEKVWPTAIDDDPRALAHEVALWLKSQHAG
jgi:hypothetical protein